MGVAKELGYTLTRLWNEVTEEEIVLWSLFFRHQSDEQQKAMKAAKSNRR